MIRIESASYKYPDGTEALLDINLEVNDGEVLAFMGANGCGKTTLLKLLIGLLKPSSGKIMLDGREYRSFKQEEIFKRVGMVFQDPNDQLFAATVEQDVAVGVANIGYKPEEISRRVKSALTLVGAEDISHKAIHTLSFGQKRRTAIAGVLAMEPQTMLLDEPTSGLDPMGTSTIMRLLRNLNRDKKVTMVIATHDIELVPLFCDRVAVMSQGCLATIGTPQKVFANISVLRESGMRLPRIAHLMEILNKQDGLDNLGMPMTIGEARRTLDKVLLKENMCLQGKSRGDKSGL
jgi:cobalt/nickel transport system ATP-binding protein